MYGLTQYYKAHALINACMYMYMYVYQPSLKMLHLAGGWDGEGERERESERKWKNGGVRLPKKIVETSSN